MQSLKADGKVNFLDFTMSYTAIVLTIEHKKASHTMGVYIMSVSRRVSYAISVHTIIAQQDFLLFHDQRQNEL